MRLEAPAAAEGGVAAVLASLALQGACAPRDGSHVIFVDLTRLPLAVYAASRARMASTSDFFAGLFGEHGGGDAVYAVCAQGAEPAGMCRLPLPVPAAFQWLVPYLDSASDRELLGALGRNPYQLDCNDACAVLSNALFLGVADTAVRAIILRVIVPGDFRDDTPPAEELAFADNFRPDRLSPEAMESTLRTLRDEGLADPLSLAAAVLRWADRGGWGAEQSARLRQLLDALAPLEELSADDFYMLADTHVSSEVLDAAIPASLTRKRMLALQDDFVRKLEEAERTLNARLERENAELARHDYE